MKIFMWDFQGVLASFSASGHEVYLTDGAVAVVEAIAGAGHEQIIISNGPQHAILEFLEDVGLDIYFPPEKVLGIGSPLRQGKKSEDAATYLKGKHFDDVIVIGDTAADMEIHRLVGGQGLLYVPEAAAWIPDGATRIIAKLEELLSEI